MTDLPDDLNTLPVLDVSYRVEVRDGREVRVPVMPETCAFYVPDDQVMAWTDRNGDAWMLARTRDGKWWKRPVNLP